MSIRNFLKKCSIQFFIITTCITIAYAIIGKVAYPHKMFGFEAFYSPLIFGFLSLIPSAIMYSKKELTLRQTLVRKALYLMSIEAILIFYACIIEHQLLEQTELCVFIFTVFIVYIATNVISWKLTEKDAAKINEALKLLQQQK